MNRSILFLLFILIGLTSEKGFSQVYSDTIFPDSAIIDRIIVTGNKKTKIHIITRELLFHEGDSLPINTLENSINRSRDNLMNIGLFNFVEIKYFKGFEHHVDVHIELTERWYLWPMPIFELADRNFNEWLLTKDFSRTNIGMYVRQENFRGRDEILQVQFLTGYSQRIGVFYTIPYINRKQNLGFSTGIYGFRNHEIAYNAVGNKLKFYRTDDEYARRDFSTFIRFTKRNGIYNFYNSLIEYRKSSTLDTVVSLNPDYFFNSSTTQQFITLSWSYRYDRRDYQPYAQRGYMFEVEVAKTGLGLLKNEPDLLAIAMGFRKFHPIGKRFNISGMIKSRITQTKDAPYFNQRALGYGADYIRGYELYVMNGQNYTLLRSNFKYILMPQKTYLVPFLNSDKFRKIPVSMFLKVFVDAGYVSDHVFGAINPLSNEWQYSYGVGYDYVTYYDLVFRFEYAINKLNEHGLFFHIGTAF